MAFLRLYLLVAAAITSSSETPVYLSVKSTDIDTLPLLYVRKVNNLDIELDLFNYTLEEVDNGQTQNDRAHENVSSKDASRDSVYERFYHPSDFEGTHRGAKRNIPYWSSFNTIAAPSNSSLTGATTNEISLSSFSHSFGWGPCYPPEDKADVNEWTYTSPQALKSTFEEAMRTKPMEYTSSISRKQSDEGEHCMHSYSNTGNDVEERSLNGMCKPGFLIIGAGKSGTSSLYHSLVKHPRVAPAVQKEIGFFKYFQDKGLKCYLSYFPSTENFMSSGSLITGEAFPGYLPYPNIIPDVRRLLGGGENEEGRSDSSGPKIIISVREPLSRAYSSYKYNYVRMALDQLRNKDETPKTDDFYKTNYLFSFEEMIHAELKNLKECLAPGGKAEMLSLEKYGARTTRKSSGNDTHYPIIDVEQCFVNSNQNPTNLPHEGYHLNDLAKNSPEKIIDIPQTNHLIRSMLARGLFILAADWWYNAFPEGDIHVVCLEELSKSTNAMEDVTSFLGLPKFDFLSVIARGRYNVGGNEGFNSLTRADDEKITKPASKIPISDELRRDVEEFFSEYNQRLFDRMGRRCPW